MAPQAMASPKMSSSVRSRLDYGKSTDKAKREKNEDFAELSETTNGLVALLADGMGGGADGERFSKQAVETTLANLQQADAQLTGQANVEQAFTAAIRELYELRQSEPRYKSSGTTLVGGLIEEAEGKIQARIANVGDSRAYLVDAQGRIRQITRDHTHYERLLEDRVSIKDARTHMQAGRLTHVLGNRLELDQIPQFFRSEQLLPGDTLVLCTDGIYKRVTDEEIAQTVASGSAQQAANALVQLALERQAQDNVTAVVVRHKVAAPWWMAAPRLVVIGVILLVLIASAVGLGLAYGSAGGTNSPSVPPSTTESGGQVLGATVTSLPATAVLILTPSATLEPGAPTSTAAPTLTATATATPTPTATPEPPPKPRPPPPPSPGLQQSQPQPQPQPQPPASDPAPPAPDPAPPAPDPAPPAPDPAPPAPDPAPPAPDPAPPAPDPAPPVPDPAPPAPDPAPPPQFVESP